MTPRVAVAQVIARDPVFLASLTDAERLVLPHMIEAWQRPDQILPTHAWRYLTAIAGRGWGKSFVFAHEINRRVQRGEAKSIALMASTEPRTDEICNEFLVSTSPPWFKAERYAGGVVWPNGARAYAFTPEAPEVPRGGNFDLSWLCELVAWPATRMQDGVTMRKAAFDNVTTATRVGRAQVLIDTTSKGRNEVTSHLLELNRRDPKNYPRISGSMFDNFMLSDAYLRAELIKYPPGKRREEEVNGAVYEEAEGALWEQGWIDVSRRGAAPELETELVACDPGLSTYATADDTGIVRAGLANGHVYITRDLSRKCKPEEWGDILIEQCLTGCAGIIIERNRGGDLLIANIRARAAFRAAKDGITIQVHELEDDGKPFPRREPGVILVRQIKTQDTKETRAYAPASHTEAGCVHIVGRMQALEDEMTTWIPGASRSPNRLDAAVYVVLELSGLDRNQPRVEPKAHVMQTIAAGRELNARLARLASRRVIG